MSRLTVLIIAAVSLAACVGQRPLDEHQRCPCAPGWTCDPLRKVCVEDGTSPGPGPDGSVLPPAGDAGASPQTTFSAAEVQAALASCSLPHGPPLAAGTPNDEAATLIGAWALCSPASVLRQTLFAPGVLFGSDGKFETMAMTGDGGMAPGVGVLSEGQWSTFCADKDNTIADANAMPCPGTSFYGILIQMHTVGGGDDETGCFVGPITFESGPARGHVIEAPAFYCSGANPNVMYDFWLVPLAPR